MCKNDAFVEFNQIGMESNNNKKGSNCNIIEQIMSQLIVYFLPFEVFLFHSIGEHMSWVVI